MQGLGFISIPTTGIERGSHTMTRKQRKYFEKDYVTTEIMITGNDDYQEAQDKAEKEIQKGMELGGFQMVEF